MAKAPLPWYKALGKSLSTAAESFGHGAGAVASFPLKVPGYIGKGASATWSVTPKPLQGLTVAAGIAGVATALATYDATSGRGRRKQFNEDDFPVPQIPPMLTPQDLMQGSQLEFGPAEGRQQGEWVARMRGTDQQRAVQQPVADVAQNAMKIE